MDLGGHRFFSKSDRVVNWWFERLPLEKTNGAPIVIHYQGKSRRLSVSSAAVPVAAGGKMLLRNRKSRIYFLRRFFDYPVQFNGDTIRKLGIMRTIRIAASYIHYALFPPRQIENLEQFFISRFGAELYRTFFKSYTEKVWGVTCDRISAEWGAQRVKGLSVGKALRHFLRSSLPFERKASPRKIETSLTEHFLYPQLGPGQMWETVAREVRENGGQILTKMDVSRFRVENNRITAAEAVDSLGRTHVFPGEYFFSTMPVRDLVNALDTEVPDQLKRISDGLQYRDFIIVGMLLSALKVREPNGAGQLISDNWIYLQEPDILASRVQVFNNWSPHLVADPTKVWLGVEYFCNEKDELWSKPDRDLSCLAGEELDRIGLIDKREVLDCVVLRVPKAYPAYFGTYDRFGDLRGYLDGFENLYLIGRNGMHKYNNQDHSMLTAMTAVDNLVAGRTDKSNLWALNTEMDYHESIPSSSQTSGPTNGVYGHSLPDGKVRPPGDGIRTGRGD
jgi:protoporphyrinogen oxidase